MAQFQGRGKIFYMFEIEPLIPSKRQMHEDNLWVEEECYRFYVSQRRVYCNFKEILDLWLLAPYCVDCATSDPFLGDRSPDISPGNWELDIICDVGFETLERTHAILKEDSDFSYLCKSCGKGLRPWDRDEIYVVKYHLEEHYGIPLESPDRKKPSKKLRKQIISLYDNKCFGCGLQNDLHIDHILPQSKGGGAAFRNIQPLCEICGNRKSNSLPEERDVWSAMYFGVFPLDNYEELFW